MKKSLLFILFAFQSFLLFAQPCREVVGYYPNWQWYDRNKLVNPQTIQYDKYSVINYSFFNPQPDGTIKITDPWADKNLLLGPINWSVAPSGYDTGYDFGNPSYHHPGQKMADYCHAHGVKFLPSIGGWTLSDNFPIIASNPQKRQTFANQCVALIQAFDFDGIDLDWEYPGFADHGGGSQDEVNFTLLLQEIRSAINTYGATVNKEMILTIAVSADPSKMDDVEWDNVVPLVDKINLMSYDFFGAFDSFTNHNSPLYAPVQGNPEFNASSAVHTLLNTYQVPASKINLGMAFYGRSQVTAGQPQLHITSTGSADLSTFSTDEGTPLYYNVLLHQQQFDFYWDDNAKVSYALGKNGLNTFLSFDDKRSIAEKAEYVVDQQLGGAIIWEITGDYIETSQGSGVISGTPLADTLNSIFCNYQGTTGLVDKSSDILTFWPNPATNQLKIVFSEPAFRYEVITLSGQQLDQNTISGLSMSLDVSDYKEGTYLLRIYYENRSVISRFVKTR